MSERPVIECCGVTVAYGLDIVLDCIDLTIPRGTLLPFVGPNGSGKTTLLKACLGLIPHQGGRLMCDFGARPPAYVPQQKQIDPIYPLSVTDLVRMGLYPELGPWGRPDVNQRARVAQALERFGLVPHRHKHFGELSGGLRQKTLLARAVVSLADVLVLDEPTAGLDEASEAEMLALIRTLHEGEGKTVLWVHHRIEHCTALAHTHCCVENRHVRLQTVSEENP
jgi:manganese/zinc/iron transport system ATP- binding protein